jgi:hypothetical protein
MQSGAAVKFPGFHPGYRLWSGIPAIRQRAARIAGVPDHSKD